YKENITREEFCELIYNLIVLASDEITAPITDSFTDTKNDKILMLNGLGIINGKSSTEFAPNDYLTREEAATIIVRMVNKVFPMAATEMWFEYDDINEISEWASDSIQTISNLGFMNGVGNNKFAPKDTYTTEQAIVTLVRVLESAGAAGLLDENTSLGIIGGADGPTSIIIGENTTVIGGADAPTQITVIDTKKVDDFYIDEATKLIKESAELAADKEFIGYYTANEEMTNKVLELGAADYSKPSKIYYMSANREQIINNIKAFSDEELDGFDIEKLLKLNKVDFSHLASMINASYGTENLAALTILTNSRGYIMPKDFTDDFALYLQYDGEYSALVSFSKFGDGVIKATMSFVNNGDRDNIFSRLYEITQGLGEDSIDVAIVK
ncbi:MAG: S-layer homology domain-containing protein, partial [Clostridia bacterium]|nr:S-layer homology domain-containing protein [Clostridia bacterium]